MNTLSIAASMLIAASSFFSCNTTEANDIMRAQEQAAAEQFIPGDTGFVVESVTPQGELPAAVRYPSIQVQFSEPVVPLSKLGESASRSDVLSITPPLKGTFRWYGTSVLSFDCAEELIPQKEYVIRIAPDLKSARGTPLCGQVTYAFRTEELRLAGIEPGYTARKERRASLNASDIPPEYARDVAVIFGNRVNASVVSRYLSVVEEGGTAHEFRAEQLDERTVLLRLKGMPGRDVQVDVVLAAGAMPDKDCIATGAEQRMSFHTLRPLDLRAVSGTSSIRIAFNHRLKDGIVHAVYESLSFSPGITVTEEQVEVHGNEVVIRDLPVTYGGSYTFSLAEDAVCDVWGQYYPRKLSQKITVPDADSYARFRDGAFIILEGQFEPRRAFELQNIREGSSYTVTPLRGAGSLPPASGARTVPLATDGDERNRRVVKVAELSPFFAEVPGGWRGAVRLEASVDCDNARGKEPGTYTTTSFIQVTDLGVSVRGSWNRAAVVVTGMASGKPVEGAEVTFYALDADRYGLELYEAVIRGDGEKAASAVTGADGLAVLLPADGQDLPRDRTGYVEVRTADDRVAFPFYGYSSAENGRQVAEVFSDRGLYRPGETASVKVIDRTLLKGGYGTYSGPYELSFTGGPWNARKTYRTVSGTMSAEGTCDATWEIPGDVEPGTYTVEYKRTDGSGMTATGSVSVQFFERLRFQASAEITPAVFRRGDVVSASVSAGYLGGGALAGGSVHADWTRTRTQFSPPGEQYKGYAFGPLVYDWYWKGSRVTDDGAFHEGGDAAIGQDGTARLSVPTSSQPADGSPYAYQLEAQVTDAGNQMIAAHATAVVHPAAFYLGLGGMQGVPGFPRKGQKVSFGYVLATPEGNGVDGALLAPGAEVSWSLTRKAWEEVVSSDEYGYEQSSWEERLVVEQSGTFPAEAAAKSPGVLSVTPAEGGRYLLSLTAEDAFGNRVVTERSFYVTGSSAYRSPSGAGRSLELTADKDGYAVGDTARILLSSPLPRGRYLVTVERSGILSERVMALDEGSTVIEVPIEEGFVPVVHVAVSTYAPRDGEPPARYADDYEDTDYADDADGATHRPYALSASVSLPVSTESRAIGLDVALDRMSYLPGSEATVTVRAASGGKPVPGAEVTLLAVDRGVLDLIGHRVPDPLSVFYAQGLFGSGTTGGDSFRHVVDPVTYGTYTLPARERAVMDYQVNRMYAMAAGADTTMKSEYAVEEAFAMDDCAAEDGGTAQVRRDFRATAVFLPALVTDADGTARATFTLPDSLTEYVVTAVCVQGQKFGLAEESLAVANPVSVRDVETRILRPGDEGEAGVVITNLGDADEEVAVRLSVAGGLAKTGYAPGPGEVVRLPGRAEVLGAAMKTVTVPAGGTRTLMYRLDAIEEGWVTLAFTVRSRQVSEVVYKALEIEKPFVYETVTTVGQVGQDERSAEERIVFPSATEDGRAAFTVQLDATRLGTLGTAVRYVFRYPYGCLEQRSSAVIPLIAFGEYIDVFGLGREVQDAQAVVKKEIASWAGMQRADGGFPYWADGRESSLAVSLRIGEVVALAKEHGIPVDAALDARKLASYIRTEIARLAESGGTRYYPEAYALYVLARLGEPVTRAELSAAMSGTGRGVSELAFAGLAALEAGEREIAREAAARMKNFMALTARGATFQASAPWYGWYFMNTESERYALALHLLSRLDAADAYNSHLVFQLLEMQRAGQGYWQSTAATGRVLVALEAYIRAAGLDRTDFTAQALLGGEKLLSGEFSGAGARPVEDTWRIAAPAGGAAKEGDRHYSSGWEELSVPLDQEMPLVFEKEGTGTLFYTAGMSYAVPAGEQGARDEGLCVYVEITDARTGKRVEGDRLESGAIYRQKVYVTTTRARSFVAVRAPVPAGAEVLNAAFITTASVPSAGEAQAGTQRYWQPRSPSHQDVYDAEIRCFWDAMPIGTQSFEFLFRAERTGTYGTPAVQAECMYEPEIFGRGDGKVWVIE